MEFKLSSSPIDVDHCRKLLISDKAGAFNCFEGWVRDHNEGKVVRELHYQAVEALCVNEASNIIAEAKLKYDILDCYCVHRIGELQIGDLAVWVGVSAAHRDQAFAACRFLIDEIKFRLPIWKKEFYSDGNSSWIACNHHDRPVQAVSA